MDGHCTAQLHQQEEGNLSNIFMKNKLKGNSHVINISDIVINEEALWIVYKTTPDGLCFRLLETGLIKVIFYRLVYSRAGLFGKIS